MKTRTALTMLVAIPALAACNPFPYAKQHHMDDMEGLNDE